MCSTQDKLFYARIFILLVILQHFLWTLLNSVCNSWKLWSVFRVRFAQLSSVFVQIGLDDYWLKVTKRILFSFALLCFFLFELHFNWIRYCVCKHLFINKRKIKTDYCKILITYVMNWYRKVILSVDIQQCVIINLIMKWLMNLNIMKSQKHYFSFYISNTFSQLHFLHQQ